jgi:hypothetical protein
LTRLPPPREITGLGCLRGVVDKYMKIIRIKANGATLGIKYLLMECPRYIKHFPLDIISDIYILGLHKRDHIGVLMQTIIHLHKYGQILHSLAHAILMTLANNPPCSYCFPFSDTNKIAAHNLMDILNGADGDQVQALSI